MNKGFFLLITTLFFLIWFAACKRAAPSFAGDWAEKSDDTSFSPQPVITIEKDSTDFEVMSNQLSLTCSNKFDGDTLLLYVRSLDCGRHFIPDLGGQRPPEENSLFAKCYLKNKELHILYTQKFFVDNISDLNLKTVLIKSSN